MHPRQFTGQLDHRDLVNLRVGVGTKHFLQRSNQGKSDYKFIHVL